MFQIIQYAVCHNRQRSSLVIKKSKANHVVNSCFNVTKWIYMVDWIGSQKPK